MVWEQQELHAPHMLLLCVVVATRPGSCNRAGGGLQYTPPA
jgi:hypothetical protein